MLEEVCEIIQWYFMELILMGKKGGVAVVLTTFHQYFLHPSAAVFGCGKRGMITCGSVAWDLVYCAPDNGLWCAPVIQHRSQSRSCGHTGVPGQHAHKEKAHSRP